MSWVGSKLQPTLPCWQSLTQRKLTEASCLDLKKAHGKEMSGEKGMEEKYTQSEEEVSHNFYLHSIHQY